MFTVDQVVTDHFPKLHSSRLFQPLIRPVLQKILHEEAFQEFAAQYPHLQGIEFIEQMLEFFHFGYNVGSHDLDNIPDAGRVVIIANHPLGSLDGIALIKLVHSVRSDVKIVANDLLTAIKPLSPFLLPVKNMSGTSGRKHIGAILQSLNKGEAVIFFPAGEVSRMHPHGIADKVWHNGFLKMAEKTKSPILPIHIHGKNSPTFYFTSTFIKPLSTSLLVREMFKQNGKQLKMSVGKLIPFDAHHGVEIRSKDKVKLFRKHVYRIGHRKKGVFVTESAIARPERKADLKADLNKRTPLGQTPDGKRIYLFEHDPTSPLLREIGRLREITFRSVGEGTGRRRDTDKFDHYYQHLILWDEDDLEIAGAYRFADGGRVMREKGPAGLYSGSLFTLDPEKCPFLSNGLELGRSFVQQKYWGKRSLDYLWFGIGAYLAQNPQYRYLFGPVTISNSMPPMAKELLIYFYKLYFGCAQQKTISLHPFHFTEPLTRLGNHFSGDNYKEDFKRLKSLLSNMGTAVPPLYKQYSELCEPGGVSFVDFNVDPDFNNCVDGLVIVDTNMIKPKKRKRYIGSDYLTNSEATN